ncbi:MAG: TonB-dependent receptor plug domain-containing protein [Planctomycetota bacterium]
MVVRRTFRTKAFMLMLTLLIVHRSSPCLFAGEPDTNDSEDFFEMSLEELMNVKITTHSKKEEKLFRTPAAAYVLTGEDIRRSGATTVADALRMVPGLQVARITSSKWAVTARGFNSEFSKKMLILIDGRSIYNPHWGGVRRDTQEVMLEDVQRIEVIRGPGGTLWGPNAINGIINVITKNAKDTQGTLLVGGGGSEERGFGKVRYGDKINENTHYRVYAEYFDRAGSTLRNGDSGRDSWQSAQGGFRIDGDPTHRDQWTLLGDIHDADVGQLVTRRFLAPPFGETVFHENTVTTGNLLGRWKRTFSEESDMIWQVYYDRRRRVEELICETFNTYDIDFQHRFQTNDRHEITWGVGYRYYRHTLDGSFNYSLDPRHRDMYLYSGFLQDRISLVPDKLELTVGSKLLDHYSTGFEYQPSGRLLWTPDRRNSVWGAITRAVRTPNRIDRDSRIRLAAFQTGPTVSILEVHGNRDIDSEDVIAYELGYRTRATDKLSFDIAGFVNVYDDLVSSESRPPISEPGLTILPNVFENNLDGETYGAEISTTYFAAKNWRLSAGYAFLQMQLHPKNPNTSRDAVIEGQSPHNEFHLRSFYCPTENLDVDFLLYYVDSLPSEDVSSYVRFDARLGWHITPNMELSVVGQNLFEDEHFEFGGEAGQFPTAVERGFYIKLKYLF